MLVGAGSAGSSVDAANLLKPALARGELQCVGATTLDEYRRYIESDAALERRFQPVFVDEPSVEDTVKILQGIRPRYEEHHRLKITDDALVRRGAAGVALHHRSVPARQGHRRHRRGCQPRPYVQGSGFAADLKEAFTELRKVQEEKEKAFAAEPTKKPSRCGTGSASCGTRWSCCELATRAGGGRRGRGRSRGHVDRRARGADRGRGERTAAADGAHASPRIVSQDEAIEAIAKAVRRAGQRAKGPTTAHWCVHLPGAHRGGQDGAGQGTGRVHVRQRGRPAASWT